MVNGSYRYRYSYGERELSLIAKQKPLKQIDAIGAVEEIGTDGFCLLLPILKLIVIVF